MVHSAAPVFAREPKGTTNLFGAAPISPMYEAIPVIVPALFVIGVVGALIYDRSHRNAE